MNEWRQPDKQIATEAINVWRITNLIEQGIMLVIGASLIVASVLFDWYHWVVVTLSILLVLDVLVGIWDIFMEPVLMQRYWRYDISREFAQVKHGIWKTKHTIVPMTKIQHVTAEQGPVLRRYHLYTLQIGTISSSIQIPALPEQEALQLRAQIAAYAKIKEVEAS